MIHNKDIIFSLQKITISILLVLCFASSTLQAAGEEDVVTLEFYPQWYSQEDVSVQGNIGIEKDFQSDDWVEYYAGANRNVFDLSSGTYSIIAE